MFKGLKSKLEDEAKRLQATVTQYGENIAQQVRTGTSENGSDISGYTRRFFSTNAPEMAERKTSQSNSERVLLPTETIISLDDDEQIATPTQQTSSSALLQGLDESEFNGGERLRRLSNASMESNESSAFGPAAIPQSASATLRLEPISSDVESNAGSTADSSSFECVPREQLSAILHKLQRRAADYKCKYNEVARAYQEVVRENEKCCSVLASTQDKALQRIGKLKAEKKELIDMARELEQRKNSEASNTASETKIQKLQDLLEKCKDRLWANKTQIAALVEENNSLKCQIEEGGQDASIEKVTAEWKGRVDRLEEEWSQRLASCDEKATIAIATSKAEMHATLQQKDQEIEKWIGKCHGLEKQDADANQRWQRKVDELNRVIVNLESEKADMVEKLSQAKQEGVKLVKEEEENKRKKLATEFDERLTIELLKKDDEWRKKLKESEDQMQLAIEEREMQKAAALKAQEWRFNELNIQIENLKTENIRLNNELSDPQRAKRDGDPVNSAEESQRKIAELEEQNATLADANAELKSKNDELIGRWESQSANDRMALDDALTEKKELDARIALLIEVQENATLKSREVELSVSKNSDDEHLLHSAMTERNELRAKVDALIQENATLTETETKLQKLLEDQKSINDESVAQRRELEERIATSTEEVEIAKKRYDELEAIQRRSEARLRENDDAINALRQKVNELNAANDVNARKVADFETQIANMAAERKKIEECHAATLDQVNKENSSCLKKLEDANASVNETLQRSKANAEALNERIAELCAQLEEKSASMTISRERIAELEAIIDAHSVDEATAECEKCADYVAKISTLNTKNEATLKHYEELESLHKKTTESLRDSQSEAKASHDALLKRLDEVVQEKDSRIAELKEALKNAPSNDILLKVQELETQLSASNLTSQAQLERIHALDKQCRTASASLRENEATVRALKSGADAFIEERATHLQRIADLETQIEKMRKESEAQEKRYTQLEKEHKFANTRQKELETLYNTARSNLQESEAKAETRRTAERDHIDTLTQENAELLRRCDELEALSELSKPTELEYLRNVLYRYMTERETLGKEVVTLTKVIGTVVKFTADQLDLAVQTEENRFNSMTWYNGAINSVQAVTQKTASGSQSSHNSSGDGFY